LDEVGSGVDWTSNYGPFCPFEEGTQTLKVGLIALVDDDGCHVALSIGSVGVVDVLYYESQVIREVFVL
jgi:hypothetical protein